MATPDGHAAFVKAAQQTILSMLDTDIVVRESSLELCDYVGALQSLVRVLDPSDQSHRAFRYMLQLCDDRLHQGPWKQVTVDWRMLYGVTAAAVAISALTREESRCSEHWHQLVEMCDKGLLLGGWNIPVLYDIIDYLSLLLTALDGSQRERRPCRCQMENRNRFDTSDVSFLLGAAPSLPPLRRAEAEAEAGAGLGNSPRHPSALLVTKTWPSFSTMVASIVGKRSCLIENGVSHWPAHTKWSWEWWDAMHGHRLVPIETGRHYASADSGTVLQSMHDFLGSFHAHAGEWSCPLHGSSANPAGSAKDSMPYLAQHDLLSQIPSLRSDILIPELIFWLEGWKEEIQSGPVPPMTLNIWMGPAGTYSPAHFDPRDNFYALLRGQKRFYLSCPDHCHPECYYPHPPASLLSNTSQVPLEAWTAQDPHFPLFAQTQWEVLDLQAGDMLYIPAGWWHAVRSMTASCAISIWWG
jgi:hypothetical protein